MAKQLPLLDESHLPGWMDDARRDVSGVCMNLFRYHEKAYIEVRRLGDAERAAIESWMDDVYRFETDQQALIVARLNVFDLEAEIESAKASAATGRSIGTEKLMAIRLQLNRRIANFLSSVRSFLDQTAHILSYRYGKPSAEFDAFEQATHEEYDGHFHYRFADALRNYTQHHGFGLDRISTSVNRQDDGTIVGVIKLFFDRDALLDSGFGWKAKAKADLEAAPEQIDILPTMTGLNDSVTRLAAKRIELESPKMLQSLRSLHVIIREVAADGPGTPMLFEHDLQNTGAINTKEFPMQTVERILASLDT